MAQRVQAGLPTARVSALRPPSQITFARDMPRARLTDQLCERTAFAAAAPRALSPHERTLSRALITSLRACAH